MKKKIIIAACLILMIVISYISVLPIWYKEKTVHVSLDDVVMCFKDLVEHRNEYTTIFDQPFFKYLKECHESTGVKITLYTYETYQNYNIVQLPAIYEKDFRDNSSWLKIGFHALGPSVSKDSISNSDSFFNSFNTVTEKLKQVAGGSTSSLRLHFFYATVQEVDSLRKLGITKLFSADDNRISYSLPHKQNEELIKTESLNFNGMYYEHSDIRVESSNPLFALWQNRDDETIVLFTHEWALQAPWNKFKFKLFLYLFKFYNCNFIID